MKFSNFYLFEVRCKRGIFFDVFFGCDYRGELVKKVFLENRAGVVALVT